MTHSANEKLEKIIKSLLPKAELFTPEDTSPIAVIDQWIQSVATGGELYGPKDNKPWKSTKELIEVLKSEGYYDSEDQFFKLIFKGIAQKPPKNPDFTFIDLFAGIGGFRIAFQNSGGACVFSSEFDKNAQRTYQHNFGELPFGDITSIDPDAIPKHDILLGGFPCQAFSVAGHREGFGDKKGRGNLFFNIRNILEAKNPKAFVLENVKNLEGHDNGNTISVIEKELRKLNYYVKKMVLNSSTHGDTPQSRDRIFIIGFKSKKALEAFLWPDPIPLTKKIEDLLENSVDEYFYYNKYDIYPTLKENIKKRDTLYQWRRVYVRENKSNLCPTLTANMGTGGHNVPLVLDQRDIRKLTPKECSRFQGFPEQYTFPEEMAKSHLYKQVGNSVTVPLVQRVAEAVIKALA
jgi:DNA (cytosine-5)-methyltransferase 1